MTTNPLPTSNPAALTHCPANVLYDYGTEDGMSTDRVTANKLPAEEQLNRFLQWLQFTDRGHQPC